MTPAEAFVAAVRHHQAGQLAEADRLYGTVLAAEPAHAHALHLRGALAHAGGRHQDAVDLIERALAREEQPDFHYNIGLALSALGRRREAADHWARAVALNPNHAAARLNLGNALREDGRLDEATAPPRSSGRNRHRCTTASAFRSRAPSGTTKRDAATRRAFRPTSQ